MLAKTSRSLCQNLHFNLLYLDTYFFSNTTEFSCKFKKLRLRQMCKINQFKGSSQHQFRKRCTFREDMNRICSLFYEDSFFFISSNSTGGMNSTMIYNISEFLDNMDIFDDNKRVSTVSYYSFVITYVLLMVFGCIGNISIIIACIRNKVFIVYKLIINYCALWVVIGSHQHD